MADNLRAWPSCGKWERRAKRARVLVTEVEGLARPRLATRTGGPPIFVLPAWARGVFRELAICWLWGEFMEWAHGEEALVRHLLRHAAPGEPPLELGATGD